MKVTEFSVHHATAVFVLIVCLVIGGLNSYNTLPREAAPDIAIPIVIVSTPYFGVSPADMETLVTQPMEKEFKGLKSLKKMTSTSAESVSLVTLEFETDVDIEEALQKVREKVDKVEPDLPPDAEDPEVIEVSSSDWPVLIANVSGDLDPARLQEIGESIQDDIEKISGVLRVDLAGGVEREIQVLLDPEKLRHHKVSVNQVIGAIQGENVNLPGGSIEIGSMKYLLRVPGEFEQVREMEDIIVKSPEGQQILLKDIAEVRDTYKDRETYSRLTVFDENADGERVVTTQPNISLSVVKRAGENIIEIAKAAKSVVHEYKRRMEPGIEVAILNDQSTNIEATVNDLVNNIISGMILVIAVLFFFMGGARNAVMVSISVPLSMLISFVVLQAMGITLNMVVLFSLILALGMLVDNAVVIVENIYRHANEGKPLDQAAIDGTQEVGWAVIASTATTVGAFFPMVFWPGVMGEFMGYLPLTVIITLLSSLFVALIINPTVAAVFLRADKSDEETSEYEVPDNAMYRVYSAALERSLDYRGVVVLLSIGAFIGTIVLYGMTANGVEFFPESTPEQFTIKIETADGKRLEATDEIVDKVVDPLDGTIDGDFGFTEAERAELNEKLAASKGLVEAWIEDVGVGGGNGMVAGGKAPHYANISVDLYPAEDQTSNPSEFMDVLREVYGRVAGATIVLEKQQMGPPSGKPVNIEIVGEDLAVMADITQRIKERIRPIPGLIDLDDDVELTRPEILVRVDRKRAALAGTSTQSIATTVRTAVNGTKASVFRDGEDEYDITVKFPEEDRATVNDLELLTVSNRDNFHVPISEVADVGVEGGTGSIRHKDQERVVSVSANAATGYLPADLLASVREELKDLEVPAGYEIRYTGENEDQAEAQEFLGQAMMIALFIIALILVTQFNSIVQPLIILSSVLLSLIGVLWSLIITGEPFGIIMTGIGIISLAGVVVNNSIVLIDYANQLRDRGMTRREAITTAGLVRFRPVLLTAMTTILGLVPLVIGVSIDFVNLKVVFGGRSVDMWGPMARAVSSGLLVATILTLVVVPVLYSLFDDIAKFFKDLLSPVTPSTPAMLLIAAIGAGALTLGLPHDAAAQQPEAQAEEDEGRFTRPEDLEGEGFTRDPADATPPVEELISFERILTLDEARQAVREKNWEVEVAMTNIAVADATIAKAYSTLFPTVAARFTSTYYDEEITANFAPPGAPEGSVPEVIIRPQLDYNLSASATLRLNGQAWPLLQQAYLSRDLNKQQVEVIRDELEFSVIQTYYNLLLTRRVVELTREQLASDRTNLRATQKRRDAGVARPFELTRAKLRVAQAEQGLQRALLNFRQLRETLAFLIRADADFDVKPSDTIALERDLAALKKVAGAERPSLLLQRTSTQLAERAYQEIYYKYLPTLELSGTAFRPRDTAFTPGRWQYSLGLTAQWILWDGGLREAELDERQAKLVSAKLQREQSAAQVSNELNRAWLEYLSQQTQLETSQTQVELAEEGLSESERAFSLGAAQQLDVIFAEDQLRQAEIALAQDELRLQLAIRKLQYLAGLD